MGTLWNLFGEVSDAFEEAFGRIKKAIFIAITGIFALAILRALMPFNFVTPVLVGLLTLLIIIVMYRIIGITEIVGVTILGEFLELFGMTQNRPGPDNEAIRLWVKVLLLVFLSMILIGITLITLPIHAKWWLSLAWPTILLVMVTVSIFAGGKAIFFASRAMLAGLVIFLVLATFPQISVQLQLERLTSWMLTTEEALTLEKFDDRLAKTRQKLWEKNVTTVVEWQESNPGKTLPADYQKFIDSWRRGEKLLLEEIKNPPPLTKKELEQQLLDDGWQKTPTVLYNATVESGGNIKIVGIYFPKTLSPGSSIVFYRFRWEMSFKGREGQFVPDYISSGGEESTVEINSVHCALLAPMDGQPLPKTVWWRPL